MNAIRDGTKIRIYDAYQIKESIKEMTGRFYDPDDKAWIVPYSKENARMLALLGVPLGEDLLGAMDQVVPEDEIPILPIEPWFDTMRPVVKNLTRYSGIVCWNLGDLYATGTQFIEPTNFYSNELFKEQGFRPIWIRIWKKQGMNFGIGPYHLVTNKPVQQYEYISAFSKNGDVEYNDQEYVWLSAFAGHAFKFVKRLTKEERKNWGYAGIWEMNTVRANKEHPAMFPVELPWRCIKMHSDKGDIVIEPFSGSGTTIIACEQLDRVCYAMEKSPTYCDLAVKRWEEFTGQKAERIIKNV